MLNTHTQLCGNTHYSEFKRQPEKIATLEYNIFAKIDLHLNAILCYIRGYIKFKFLGMYKVNTRFNFF